MGFETLSSAIAHVIVNYHAHQTQTNPVSTDNQDTLEHILNCTTEEINSTIEAKIVEATTGTNSSRLTLLQYMHFGLTLSEQARHAETTNVAEIKAIKPQLLQFIQNLQLLLATGYINYFSRTLSIPTTHEKNLSIYRLDNSTHMASTLTLNLLTTIGLSRDSTEASIQKNITDRFDNKILSSQNQTLKAELEALHADIATHTTELEALTQKKSKPATSPRSATPGNTDKDEMEGWEAITHASEQEKNTALFAQNETLSRHLEEASKRMGILKNLITTLQSNQKNSAPLPTEDLSGLYRRTQRYSFHTSSASGVVTTQPTDDDQPTHASTQQNRFSFTALFPSFTSTSTNQNNSNANMANGTKCD